MNPPPARKRGKSSSNPNSIPSWGWWVIGLALAAIAIFLFVVTGAASRVLTSPGFYVGACILASAFFAVVGWMSKATQASSEETRDHRTTYRWLSISFLVVGGLIYVWTLPLVPRSPDAARLDLALPIVLFLLLLYFIPACVAIFGGSRHAVAISLLNLLLGWTILGWIGALIWAVAEIESKPRSKHH